MKRLPSSGLLWWIPSSPFPCPVCRLEGGFHDHRDLVEVPRELLKEKGWHEKGDDDEVTEG